MTQPFIFCHMLISIDGKITGKYMNTPEGEAAGDFFYQLAFGKKPFYKNQGWLSGRKTTDDNFTMYKEPILPKNFEAVPAGDYIIETGKPIYYISIDPSGKLGWEKNTITYQNTTATVIEVLTEKVSDSYKTFLRSLDIPYIIAGKESIDPKQTVDKLQQHFNLESIMLGGGGLLNWSFIEAGVCDEISLVVAPVADGSSDSPSVFENGSLSSDKAVAFSLEQAQTQEDGTLWLRYKVKK
ncbi:dihydrofolate reductase family protein [Enterococcus sp. AZ109]|uniref:dihydrofolate reductase family protein n=1 Tax=Enterococcus sp. AZ109 TaxID=2774634 RepID=UPI003F2666F5